MDKSLLNSFSKILFLKYFVLCLYFENNKIKIFIIIIAYGKILDFFYIQYKNYKCIQN